MDIEDLSKSQLLLLTILVNFVVSIATGVMTISLLDEAPTTVTQTVNRIVDHTIETVTTQVPVIGSSEDKAPTTEELLTAAIAANVARTVTLSRAGTSGMLATGVFLPDARAVVSVSDDLPAVVKVTFSDGTEAEATRTGKEGGLVRYVFAADAALPQAPSANLTDSSALKQGQTVIGLSSDRSAVTSIISRIDENGIYAVLPGVPQGAAIVNLSGSVVGINAGGVYLPAERIKTFVEPSP
ncbi:MAG TPA: hypothetical protein VEB18_02960 [Candidatus Paceibacterota bacterium]|nr:hypothetical protein [Candidatus Paceibacterota bacterium]